MEKGKNIRNDSEDLFWEIAEEFIQEEKIEDIGMIEELSIGLEGKMNEILANPYLQTVPPQESNEFLHELIYGEMIELRQEWNA